MAKRGQNNEAWLARWRDGACPVHGGGFVDDGAADELGVVPVRCSNDECDVRAARYARPVDAVGEHASFGWRAGPDVIKALLAKAGDIDGESDRPGVRARVVRIALPLE